MANPSFLTWSDVEHGVAAPVSPLIRRVIADNPGKFTYTGTGTYLIGTGEVAVVDPGPDNRAHVEALLRELDGETVSHILVTHTHSDHSPATRALVAETDATTYGFGPHPPDDIRPVEPETDGEPAAGEEPGDFAFVPDVTVGHGDSIEGAGWKVEAVHTPGHISNHLCFALEQEHTLFSGDHVMGWSTTVIPPPAGDLRAYIASLRLVIDRDDQRYLPTHGPPIDHPRPYVEWLLEHRLERERQIIGQLELGPRTIPEIVAVLYAAVDEKLHKPAGLSVYAHLLALEADGTVAPVTDEGSEAIYRLT
ncbi:MAG: MBL fold metallo-hydrolase [Acidimicrobiia bacterium]|nr:MBL fold metallo-hydrolase [Acidimicrobiia bacterium]